MIDEGELVVTAQAHADLLDERDRLRDLLRVAAAALKSCEQVLCEVTRKSDFHNLADHVRELTDAELGRLWIEVGRQAQDIRVRIREAIGEGEQAWQADREE